MTRDSLQKKFQIKIALLGGFWFFIALLIGFLQILKHLPPPAIQITLILLTALILVFYFRSSKLFEEIQGLPLKNLIALHLVRFVGFYFLYLYSKGELPYHFAVWGGRGDITIAGGALLLCFLPLNNSWWFKAVWIWNTLGLLDILFVVGSAAQAGLQNPFSMEPLTHLPLSLLPTFFVPLIIASHVMIFSRIVHQKGKDLRMFALP